MRVTVTKRIKKTQNTKTPIEYILGADLMSNYRFWNSGINKPNTNTLTFK